MTLQCPSTKTFRLVFRTHEIAEIGQCKWNAKMKNYKKRQMWSSEFTNLLKDQGLNGDGI